MKQIGTQIRALRKQHDLTQEQLAALLDVSAQAVSKWENGLTAPDITLLPVLAGVFKVSIDQLFDYNKQEVEAQVEAICQESWQYREKEPLRSRQIIQEGLRRFPGDPILLNNYLCTFDLSAENDEVISVATRLAESVEGDRKLDDVYYDALRFQAEAYARRGELDFARVTLERIPEIYFTKLSVAAQILTGEEKRSAASQQKWICLEIMVDMMRELAIYYDSQNQPEKATAERRKALELIDLFSQGPDHWVERLRIEVQK